jgi:hypothetical protein
MQSCCASAVAACTETAVCVPKHLAGRANWPATQKSVDVDGKPPTRQGTGVCQPRVNPRSIRSRIGQQGGLPRASDRTPVPTRRVRAPACGFDEPLRGLPHRDAPSMTIGGCDAAEAVRCLRQPEYCERRRAREWLPYDVLRPLGGSRVLEPELPEPPVELHPRYSKLSRRPHFVPIDVAHGLFNGSSLERTEVGTRQRRTVPDSQG